LKAFAKFLLLAAVIVSLIDDAISFEVLLFEFVLQLAGIILESCSLEISTKQVLA